MIRSCLCVISNLKQEERGGGSVEDYLLEECLEWDVEGVFEQLWPTTFM